MMKSSKFPKPYFRNIRGYSCREHNLYNMNYIEATTHFALHHNMTLDDVDRSEDMQGN